MINGNGATIETTTNGRALDIQAAVELTINDVNFVTTKGGSAIFTYHGKADGSTVKIDGCTFNGYGTTMTLANMNGGEVVNCEFNSQNVDIVVTGAKGEVLIEGNSYTANPSLENIGIGMNNTEMSKVIINDTGIIVNRYSK